VAPRSETRNVFARLNNEMSRSIAEAVSLWLITMTARVRSRVWSSGICSGQSGAGEDFLRVLRFPLPIFIPPNSPSSQSPGPRTIGLKWPTCRVDPVWTPPPHYANHKKTMRLRVRIQVEAWICIRNFFFRSSVFLFR
jgi:hypothetical protein